MSESSEEEQPINDPNIKIIENEELKVQSNNKDSMDLVDIIEKNKKMTKSSPIITGKFHEVLEIKIEASQNSSLDNNISEIDFVETKDKSSDSIKDSYNDKFENDIPVFDQNFEVDPPIVIKNSLNEEDDIGLKNKLDTEIEDSIETIDKNDFVEDISLMDILQKDIDDIEDDSIIDIKEDSVIDIKKDPVIILPILSENIERHQSNDIPLLEEEQKV
jgi:hypothetical protein